MIKLKLNKTQYIKNCSTEKAHAVKFSKYDNEMIFISKNHSTFEEVTVKRLDNFSKHWVISFPLWLYDRLTDGQKDSIKMILKENGTDE